MWSVSRVGNVIQAGYGSAGDFPQFVAFDTASGFLRLVPTTSSGWGASVLVLPSYWTGGALLQGAATTTTTATDGSVLVLTFGAMVGALSVQGTLRIDPPANGAIAAAVSAATSGDVRLDARPGEAFKPVFLASMHVSTTQWDSQSAFVGGQTYPFPAEGWIIAAPVPATVFGLPGGTSSWKSRAPTIEITFEQSLPVTGFVTRTSDPNHDNVGFWAASDTLLGRWHYRIRAVAQ